MDEKRLFIADDNAEFAEFCAKVARGEGWTVTLCADGLELLEAIGSEDAAALLLCDLNMPRLDGIEVIRGLHAARRRLLVRFMTGGAPVNAVTANLLAREHGLVVREHIRKPISLSDIRAILASDEVEILRLSLD